jgi:hypothetical protein
MNKTDEPKLFTCPFCGPCTGVHGTVYSAKGSDRTPQEILRLLPEAARGKRAADEPPEAAGKEAAGGADEGVPAKKKGKRGGR